MFSLTGVYQLGKFHLPILGIRDTLRTALNVIARRTLADFWTKRPNARAALSSWYAVVRRASWDSFADIRATFNSADAVGGGKVVFDIGGNNYRLVGLVGYRAKRVFVLWVGTHAEYDKIDVAKL